MPVSIVGLQVGRLNPYDMEEIPYELLRHLQYCKKYCIIFQTHITPLNQPKVCAQAQAFLPPSPGPVPGFMLCGVLYVSSRRNHGICW